MFNSTTQYLYYLLWVPTIGIFNNYKIIYVYIIIIEIISLFYVGSTKSFFHLILVMYLRKKVFKI